MSYAVEPLPPVLLKTIDEVLLPERTSPPDRGFARVEGLASRLRIVANADRSFGQRHCHLVHDDSWPREQSDVQGEREWRRRSSDHPGRRLGQRLRDFGPKSEPTTPSRREPVIDGAFG